MTIAEIITDPIVIPILLSIGFLGLAMELFSTRFGALGFIGLTSLLLFFYGHFIAGFAGYESIVLFIVGIGLLVLELFVPGGLIGFIGGVAILGSFLLAGENIVHMGISIAIALFISIIAMFYMMKIVGRKISVFNKMILTDSTNTAQGYVSNINRIDLLESIGIAITPLRPSGKVKIREEIVDAVSEGEFILKEQMVKIIKVEGSRIVVRKIQE